MLVFFIIITIISLLGYTLNWHNFEDENHVLRKVKRVMETQKWYQYNVWLPTYTKHKQSFVLMWLEYESKVFFFLHYDWVGNFYEYNIIRH